MEEVIERLQVIEDLLRHVFLSQEENPFDDSSVEVPTLVTEVSNAE
jgi:hypothetical protein